MKTILIIVGAAILLSLGGCTRTIYIPTTLPPSLIAPVDMPYLIGVDNDALYEYALQCRAELRHADTRFSIIREMQEQ
jgi:hypothetical protein